MAEQKLESPTLEKPQATEIVSKPAETINVDEVLATLEKAGVTSAKKAEGVIEASRQAGRLANQLGDTRAELELTRKALEDARKTKPQSTYDGSFSEQEGQGVDLEQVIAKVFRSERQRENTEMATRQKQVLTVWNQIQSDEDYPLVKEVWENRLKDPNFVFEIQQGLKDPSREYQETVRNFYKGVITKAGQTIKILQGGGNVPLQPHVETSGTRGQSQGNLVHEGTRPMSPKAKKQQELLEKTKHGYVADFDEIIDTMDDVINSAFNKGK